MFFGEKIWKKDFQLFSKKSSQIFYDFDPKQLILHSISKLKKKKKKKKNSQNKNLSW